MDLGLSVKWASCNVGANATEEYGDYFAWGETSPKSDYSWSSYKWCNGSPKTLTKYNTNSSYGSVVDSKTTLDLEDDAARANWGGSWRMPTSAEFDELKNNCDGVWTTQNGVSGYKFTARNGSGNSIFLPAAGWWRGSSRIDDGFRGYYWSSSLSGSLSDNAMSVVFNGTYALIGHANRSYGQSVRPVCD